MKRDGYEDVGRWIAFCLGRMIEQKWIRFEPVSSKRCLAAGLVGSVVVYFMLETMWPPMISLLGAHWGTFAANMVVFLFILSVWPLVLKAVQKNEHEQRQPDEHRRRK